MKILFVRHGHPNYEKDCLTELGHTQAEAAAQRLREWGITEIHASSCGRAVETAQHTAAYLGLSVTAHDFMREIEWGSLDGTELPLEGHPWDTFEDMILRGQPIMDPDWGKTELFRRNLAVLEVEKIARGIDDWLEKLGYTREGEYYRVTGSNTNRTVAMFSHGGASVAALSHLFNIPFPLACACFQIGLTSITVVDLSNEPGILASPRLERLNDCRHLQNA